MKPHIRMINQFLLVTAIASSLFFGLQYTPNSEAIAIPIPEVVPTPKAQSPIKIKINAPTKISLNQPAQFSVDLTTGIDVEKIKLEIRLPSNAALNSGELNWNGTLIRGESQSLDFTITLTEQTEQTIEAIAKVVDAQQVVVFSTRDQFNWLPSSAANLNKGNSLSVSVSPKRTTRKGYPIIEYPAE